MGDIIYGWHWVADTGRLLHRDHREVWPGETLSICAVHHPELCLVGMHASESITDALRYAPGHWLCRVAVWGDVQAGQDKVCGRHRHVLWMVNAEEVLWAWVCDMAEHALSQELQAGRSVDPRSYAAIALRREWLAGYDVDDAAWDAAEAAAMDAAVQNAARYSVRDPAKGVSWCAAEAAAEAAARHHAREPARGAMWCAAEAHARGVTRADARDAAKVVFDQWLASACVDEAIRLGVWCPDYTPEDVPATDDGGSDG